MNSENLSILLDRYEEGLTSTMGSVQHEQFKWVAVKCFRDNWFANLNSDMPFSVMFGQAMKQCGSLTDTSSRNPTSGIVKMAEAEENYVRKLFTEVLFADDHGYIEETQQHMNDFVDQYNSLLKKYYPKSWRYPVDVRLTSCLLSFVDPEKHFIYRYREANNMAGHIWFDKELGAGKHFSLPAYYEMCELIAEAIRERPSLVEKVHACLDNNCWHGNDINLITWDFIYCCSCNQYYHGLTSASGLIRNSRTVKKNKRNAALLAQRETKMAELNSLQDEKDNLESKLAECEIASLVGVEVASDAYGSGTVIEQNGIQITVQFREIEKSFYIHRKYPQRPAFEDEELLLDLFSTYGDIVDSIKKIDEKITSRNKELERIDAQLE